MSTLLAVNLACVSYIHCYSLSKFSSLGTREQLAIMQRHKIEKLHMMAGSKLLRKYFIRVDVNSNSLILILIEWSLTSIICR